MRLRPANRSIPALGMRGFIQSQSIASVLAGRSGCFQLIFQLGFSQVQSADIAD